MAGALLWAYCDFVAGAVNCVTFGHVARFQKSKEVSGETCVTLSVEVLLLRTALAGLRDVNLDVQISWRAHALCEP